MLIILIDGILKSRKIFLYGKKAVKIPAPDYYVFYNGKENAPDKQDLKLSDSFMTPKEGYEWTAHMLNVNANHNKKLLDACPALKSYALLVRYTREFQKKNFSLNKSVEKAIDRCIQENLLKNYLLKKKAEVNLMLLTEFNEEAFTRIIREEGRNEGENRVNQLHSRLISEKRFEDLERAVNDKQFQEKLYKEYGL